MKLKYWLMISGIVLILSITFLLNIPQETITIPIFNTLIESGEYVEATSFVPIINNEGVYIS